VDVTKHTGLKPSRRNFQKLKEPILSSQIIQSHTIFKWNFVEKYRDVPVLIVGSVGKNAYKVAGRYGFKRPIVPSDILRWKDSVWPHSYWHKDHTYNRTDFSKERIHAIFVFHDSYDWGRDTQIIVDLLTSNYGYIESSALSNEASKLEIPKKEIEALEEAGVKKPQRRPYMAELCNNVSDAEKWRMQVIKEISKHVLHIQNESLEEHKIRDLNDHINKLIREKAHWEHRIVELGGPNHFSGPAVSEEGDDGAIRAPGGYYYFGAAKNLPGVQDLLKPKKSDDSKRTRYDMYQAIDSDYYGYRDDEDGLLESLENQVEQKLKKEALLDWELAQIQKFGTTAVDQEVEKMNSAANFKSHVALPSDDEIEQLLLKRRKEEILRKYL